MPSDRGGSSSAEENKVAPKNRQRLANVIACKNVIKDQSLPLKRLLRARDHRLSEKTAFFLNPLCVLAFSALTKKWYITWLAALPFDSLESFN